MWEVSSELPWIAEYDKLRKNKVEENIRITDELFDSSKRLKNSLESYKSAYFEFLSIATKNEKEFSSFANSSSTRLINNLIKIDLLIANIESIKTVWINNKLAKSNYEYIKTYLSLKLADEINKDYTTLLVDSVITTNIFAKNTNSEISTWLKVFENEMEKVENLNSNLDEVNNYSIYLSTGLKQLEAWDYYFAQASIEFINKNIPIIRKELNNINPTSSFWDEDLTITKEYLDLFEKFWTELNANFQALDKNWLIWFNEKWTINFIQKADAEDWALSKSFWVLKEDSSTASKIFSGLKSVAGKAASITWKWAKLWFNAAQTVVWVTLETADTAAKSTFDVYHWVMNGNTTTEIATEITKNVTKLWTKIINWNAWSSVLVEAGNQIEWAENIVKDSIEGSRIGKGRTSWTVWNVAKISAWMFTTLWKWIYKLANKESSVWTLIEWWLDVWTSLIWGSKILLEWGTAGGKQAGKAFLTKTFNYLKTLWNKLEQWEAKAITRELLKKTKLSSSEVTTLITTSLELEWKQAIAAQLQVINKWINEKITKLLKDWLAWIIKNAWWSAEKIASNYKDMVKEIYKSNLTWYKDSLLKVLWSWYEDYIDNLVTEKVNDYLKESARIFVDASGFDWDYEWSMPAEYMSNQPVKIKISGSKISWWTEYNLGDAKWSLKYTFIFEWAISEKWEVINGKWNAVIWWWWSSNDGKCNDRLDGTWIWTYIWGIDSNSKLSITLSGNQTLKWTFVCNPRNDSSKVDPFIIILNKK